MRLMSFRFMVILALTLAVALPIKVLVQQQFTIIGFTLGGSAGVSSSTGGIYTLTGSLTSLNGPSLLGGQYLVHGGILTIPICQRIYLPIILRVPCIYLPIILRVP